MNTKKRMTLFLNEMLKTIEEEIVQKTKTYAINELYEKITKDVLSFISVINKNNDLDNHLSQVDIKNTDSIQDKLFEYRLFFKNILPNKKYMVFKMNIIQYINTFLLL